MTIQLTVLHTCEWCDKPIHTVADKGRPRIYCSDYCRKAADYQRRQTALRPTEKRCPDCTLIHAGECA